MARRTSASDKLLGVLMVIAAIIAAPILFVKWLGERLGWPVLIGGGVVIVAIIIAQRIASRKEEAARQQREEEERQRALAERRAALMAKYGDAGIMERIMARQIWQGQTAEQLKESIGVAVDIDERVYKTKTKQVWKYHQTGANRFGLRITLENEIVVGWDEKL